MGDTQQRPSNASGTGIAALAACVLLGMVNSMVFAVSNGRHRHPTLQIGDFGLIGNFFAFVAAWIVFSRCRRTGVIQSLIAITLLTIVHYYFISNLWTMIAHRM
jgi:hypothetical protein